jgi:hypothetical protein
MQRKGRSARAGTHDAKVGAGDRAWVTTRASGAPQPSKVEIACITFK